MRKSLSCLFSLFLSLLAGCNSTEQSLLTASLIGAQAPANEVQQIYYLGVFDPMEQVEPTIYRVRVHGQASALSFKRFASGWVPANLVDSLSTGLQFNNDTGSIKIDQSNSPNLSKLSTNRRLMLFGPEGFREAPADHRLVILMGSNPESFFKAVNSSINVVNQHLSLEREQGLEQLLLTALLSARDEKDDLKALQESIELNTGGEQQ